MNTNPQTKECANCSSHFTIEPEDFLFYEKIDVPPPDICVECRQQLRTLFRNFKTLYKRPSSFSGKSIVSVYHDQTPFPVYDVTEWWSDGWDAMTYGVDLDLEKSFFSQITELFNTVPHIAVHNSRSENCEYANQVDSSKNCYLAFGCLENEDCDYGHIIWNCRDTVDNLYMFKCESCYESIDCLGSNKLLYSQECESCVDSIGLFDCRNCLNCIGCVGLVNKSYHIFNQPVSREEYKEFLDSYPLYDRASIEYILEKRDALRAQLPQRSFVGSHNQDVSGNHIYNSHNIHNSFDIKGGENSKYCFTVREAIDSYDMSFTGDGSECYQTLTMIGSNKVMGSQTIGDSHDVYYSDNCYGSND